MRAREFLFELFFNGFENRNRKYVELFINPTSKELQQLESHDTIRAFLTEDDCIAWDSNLALHYEVSENINLDKNTVSILLYYTPSEPNILILVTDFTKKSQWFHNPNLADWIKDHPYIQSLADEGYIDISYFDEDIYGDWENLEDESS